MARKLAVGLCGLGLSLIGTSPAYADASYLNEAIQALQSGTVYVSAEAYDIDSASVESLRLATKGTRIGIVALPDAAANETSGDVSEFVERVAVASDKNIVIVAIGNDLEAFEKSAQSDRVDVIANDAERDYAGSPGQALVSSVETISSLGREQAPPPDSDTGSNGFSLVPGAGIGVLMLLAVSGVVIMRRLRRGHTDDRSPQALSAPDEVEKLLRDLETQLLNIGSSAGNPSPDDTHWDDISRSLNQSLTHTREYFSRLKGNDRFLEMTENFRDTLQRVTKSMATYDDARQHPDYYSEPSNVYDGMRTIASNYREAVLERIRDLTEGRVTTLNVDTKMVTGASKTDPFKQ